MSIPFLVSEKPSVKAGDNSQVKVMNKVSRTKEIAREEGFWKLIKGTLKWNQKWPLDMLLFLPVLREIAWSLSIHKLEDRIQQERCLSDILDTAFNFRGYGICNSIRPFQVKEEIRELAKIVKREKPKIVMEIGTARGGTLYIWARHLDSVSKLISLDLPRGKLEGVYSKYKIPFYNKFAVDKGKKMIFERKNSHNIETKREIERILGGSKIDFLFIDGDHSYEGVSQDFEMYSPLVSENGIIAIHDIVFKRVEVSIFWNEIKGSYRYKEIIEDVNQDSGGIGILELC